MAGLAKRGHITKSMIATACQRNHMVSLKGLTRLVFDTAVRAPVTIPVQRPTPDGLGINARPVHRRRALIKQFVLIAPAVFSDDTAHETRL